ncbi:hypothetical protein [Methanolobus psychrotolerans]|uniref:hypothetical protein n=1 Tax=Methanolobus psychrotolerans TaxID=1874706 RepID=UPI0013EBB39F|nr:hypothetical protein [Methanolobus psychrotolerans]
MRGDRVWLIDFEHREIEEESRTFAELCDTLLLKLISGELRIKDAEPIIESMPDE